MTFRGLCPLCCRLLQHGRWPQLASVEVDPIRVAVVDDHEMVLQGLLAALEAEPGIEVAASASSVAAFRELAPTIEADVVVTDWQLQDGTGSDIAQVATSHNRNIAILMISGFRDDHTVTSAIEAGCSGFVGKGAGVRELTRAIRSVVTGAAVFPADMLSSVVRRETGPKGEALTARETEVLSLLAEAKTVDEITDQLHLSVHTVRNHVRALLTKLHARSQLEAVVEGVRAGLVRVE